MIESSYINIICFCTSNMIWSRILKALNKIKLHILTWAEDQSQVANILLEPQYSCDIQPHMF